MHVEILNIKISNDLNHLYLTILLVNVLFIYVTKNSTNKIYYSQSIWLAYLN